MRPMRSITAWALAGVTVFAGVVCACDVSAPGMSDEPGGHHHHHAAADHADACAHEAHEAHEEGCGDCGLDTPFADRLPSAAPAQADAPDEVQLAGAILPTPHRHGIRSHDPPRRAPLIASTPVSRFDILLD